MINQQKWQPCVAVVVARHLNSGPRDQKTLTRIEAARQNTDVHGHITKRAVYFPNDQSIGELFLLPADAESKPKLIGEAKGEMFVGAQARLFLIFNFDPAYGCSGLQRVSPDCLSGLSLLGTEATENDLTCITHLESLEELDISCTRMTDECLDLVVQLKNLKKLNLASTSVTDAALARLHELPALEEVVLDNTQISDDGLAHLKALTNLSTLSLSFTKIGSRGLSSIKDLTHLKNLRLNSTSVTNAGVVFLAEMKELEELWLKGTNVSYRGLAELTASLPSCVVFL